MAIERQNAELFELTTSEVSFIFGSELPFACIFIGNQIVAGGVAQNSTHRKVRINLRLYYIC
jgi:hypothetical protein